MWLKDQLKGTEHSKSLPLLSSTTSQGRTLSGLQHPTCPWPLGLVFCHTITSVMQLSNLQAAMHDAHVCVSVSVSSASLLMTKRLAKLPYIDVKASPMDSLPLRCREAPLPQGHAEGLAGAAAAAGACCLHTGDQPVDTPGAMGLP